MAGRHTFYRKLRVLYKTSGVQGDCLSLVAEMFTVSREPDVAMVVA